MRLIRLALALVVLVARAQAGSAGTIPESIRTAEKSHVEIYRKNAPAVVGLSCNGVVRSNNNIKGTFFGTGVVVSADGLILTSTSVVPKDATEIKVYFTDGYIRPAEVKQSDEASEGVLVKVDAEKLPFMRLAPSADYRVGDPVYSWGNPYFTIQQDGVVSLGTGTISGLYDVGSVDDESRYIGPVIETDAALNPGSDGGPLTDAEGNLLGIMSLGFSRTRWLGLAIPTARLVAGIPELKPLVTAKRPSLTGSLGQTWALQKAFAEVATDVAKATVAVRVMHEDEKEEPPLDRTSEGLKPQTPIARPMRAAFEAKRPAQGTNTGFLVSADGVVITAAYNVDADGSKPKGPPPPKIKKIFLYLADGSRVEARLLAVHKGYGLAALKFDPPAGKTLDFVEFSDSTSLLSGSSIALLGRSEPPGTPTLNAGRISAVSRIRDTCFQVSCLTNYGNLGGPVLDLRGRVVGMSTHLSEGSPWRQNCGVAFMLKGELIRASLPDLIAGKSVDAPKRAIIGIQGEPTGTEARITMVVPTSPGGKAGLKAGDVIIFFNDKEIADWTGLLKELRGAKPGQAVKLKVKRNNEQLEFSLELGEGV